MNEDHHLRTKRKFHIASIHVSVYATKPFNRRVGLSVLTHTEHTRRLAMFKNGIYAHRTLRNFINDAFITKCQ